MSQGKLFQDLVDFDYRKLNKRSYEYAFLHARSGSKIANWL